MKIFVASLIMLAFILDCSFAKAQRKFELNDLDNLCFIEDPQISPDGKSVLIVVYKADTITNTNNSFIYKVDVATGNSQQLTYNRPFVSYPRWSPDGKNIAYIAGDGSPTHGQIFILPLSGGEPIKLTDSPTGVQQFSWRPDGMAIAFVQEDEPENKAAIAKGYDAFEVKSNSMFLKTKPLSSHIWLIAITGGKATRLTSGTWSLPNYSIASFVPSPLSWSPDGKFIAFQKNESPYSGALIYTIETIEVATGKIARITSSEIKSNDMFRERQAIFSPDGKYISYLFKEQNGPSFAQVYYTNANGGTRKNITGNLDRNFYEKEWSTDSKSLLTAANDDNTVGLWLQPLDGAAKKINLNNLSITGSFWSNFNIGKNNSIAIVASTSQTPEELYWLDNPTATPKKLTSFNAKSDSIKFGKQETVRWKSDQFMPNGILTFPPDFDPQKKYPLVLEIHGGPTAASKEEFTSYIQLEAAHEYIVFSPNYRGSDNMGHEFEYVIDGDMCEGPGRDIINGITGLKKRSYIDTNKIGVSGWSYGGTMASWLIGNYKGWTCAAVGAAVTDFFDQYAESDIGSTWKYVFNQSKPIFSASDKTSKENWIKQSPITYAENVTTPTLILSDAGDVRVPISQSYKFFRVLQDIGTESKFIVFPIGGHVPIDPIRSKELNRFILEWLDKYLK